MALDKMDTLDCDFGAIPMENTLCVFKLKPTDQIKIGFILGSIIFDDSTAKFLVKEFGKQNKYKSELFEVYQNVANEQGGFYFINQNN